MSGFKIKMKKGLLKLYIVILFVLVYGLIVALFPKERKFEYEFQLGAPWKHSDLIASYDFPVLKSDEEIKKEKDSIRKSFSPYYVFDSTARKKSIEEFEIAYDKYWKKFWAEKNLKPLVLSLKSLRKPLFDKDNLRELYLNSYDSIYNMGVIENDSLYQPGDDIQILKGDKSGTLPAGSFMLITKAKSQIEKIVKQKVLLGKHDTVLLEFISGFDAGKYIRPNYIFDDETNQKIINKKLNNISLTRGMIQEGELIIQEGGIIDEKTFIILQSLKKEYQSSASVTNKGLLIFGISLLYAATAIALFLFLWNFKPKILRSAKKITFVLLQVLWVMVLTLVISRFTDISVYAIPFAIVPMVINTFYDSRTALFFHLIIVLMAGFVAPNGFEFVFLQMIAGIVAVFGLNNIQKRKQLFITSFYVLIAYALTYFSIQMLYGNGIDQLVWTDFAWFGGNAVLLLFTFPVIYAFEKLFGFVSDVTLMELADTNNPLLQQLAQKAPGTFQHSIQVGNLAESVAREIGGNPQLVRTGALYHDIGKATNPQYFIENQSGQNPHDKLDFDESAEVIISHVTKGVKMAKKAGLPDQITDFIRTHHGTGRTEYFYRSYVNKYPDREVDEVRFKYPGPPPQNLENAVLMMADAVEAATRTLESYKEEKIRSMVSKIIDSQRDSGQFEDVDLTFKKLNKAKRVFTEKIVSIYHARIEYPEMNKASKDAEDKQ